MGEVTAVVFKNQLSTRTTKKKKLVLLKGMDTKANGEFNFEDLPIVTPHWYSVSLQPVSKSQDVPFTIMPCSSRRRARRASQCLAVRRHSFLREGPGHRQAAE